MLSMVTQSSHYRKHTILASLLLMLTACTLPFRAYHPTLEQGNILSPAQITAIKPGMTKTEVVQAIGDPVLRNCFNDEHWHYTYWIKKSPAPTRHQNLDLFFKNNRVIRVQRAAYVPS